MRKTFTVAAWLAFAIALGVYVRDEHRRQTERDRAVARFDAMAAELMKHEWASDAVDTAEIAGDAVSPAEIAGGTVDTARIHDGPR